MTSKPRRSNPRRRPLPPLRPGAASSRLGVIAVVATFGGLLFGYDTGVVNGALDSMERGLGLVPLTEGIVTSVLLLGAAVGAVTVGRIADRFGRKPTITALAVLFFVAASAAVVAPTWQVLSGARLALGLAVGGASVVVPLFLAEIAPTERRGGLVTRNELMIVSGQLAAFSINAVIGTVLGQSDDAWRYMLAVAVLPAIALFAGMLRAPESPRWLLAHGRDDEARRVLRLIRDLERAEAEFAEMRAFARSSVDPPVATVRDLRHGWVRAMVLIGIGLSVAQQLTGINSIMYYGTQVLQESGFSEQAALIANVASGVVAVAALLVGIRFVNRVDRRTFLIVGFIGTSTFHLLIGLASALIPAGPARAVVVLVFIVGFVASMQGAIGPIVWLILSEIFPLRMRGLAMGIAVLGNWLTNFAITLVFPVVIDRFGIPITFFAFTLLNVAALVFVITTVPETRGRSLEQLENDFSTGERAGLRAL